MGGSLCSLLHHDLGPAEADGSSPCRTHRTCRRCKRVFTDVRHADPETVSAPGAPGITIVRCARCHMEFTEWLTADAVRSSTLRSVNAERT